MADLMAYPEDDPRHHTIKLHGMLTAAVRHAREDLSKIDEPKAPGTVRDYGRSLRRAGHGHGGLALTAARTRTDGIGTERHSWLAHTGHW